MTKKVLFFITLLWLIIIQSISVCALTIQYDGLTTKYTGSVYELRVNGKKLTLPLTPIIFNDRALVPVREVFEALDSTVTYQEKTKCVDVEYDGNHISLYINTPIAYINGKKTTIPDNAVPKLINEVGKDAKTMVPVRFISESLNMSVEFKDPVIYISNTGTPEPTSTPKPTAKPTTKPITTPKPTSAPTPSVTSNLTKISFTDSGNGVVTTKAIFSGSPGSVSGFILNNPTRLVIDIYNCNYLVNSAYAVDINGISKIRVGFEDGRTRLVFDAENISSAHAVMKNNTLTITTGTSGSATSKVTVDTSGQAATTPKPTTPTSTPTPVDISKIPYAEHSNSEKLIVIDAGHGGKDGGASGLLSGDTILEKNLTLSMAKKTAAILQSKGYTVKLTRETDTYPTLQARADFANNSNAAIFVSLHINSVASAPEASGTEVFYAPLNDDNSYGVPSSTLATYLQNYLIANLGSVDRGVKTSNHLITRTAIMPSALVEVGFISNEAELKKMISDNYQQKVATAVSAGIIKALDKIEIPANRKQLLEERKKALEEWENEQ